MNIRQMTEEIEGQTLSPLAAKSKNSRGRRLEEPKCDIRTDFQRDRDRIIHSKAFRRLKDKTQVFLSPIGDHYRTRLTHTLEVSQIARTIARALRLNEDLTETIALGHDLGHTPFGHAGERALNQICPYGFKHNEQSLRVVDILERKNGLNLTDEVRDGILNHKIDGNPYTLEGQVVKISDRIAYINHDIDDAIRAGVLTIEQLPEQCIELLGDSYSKRIDTMIKDVVAASFDKPKIEMSLEIGKVTDQLRKFMFENVYVGSTTKIETKTKNIISELYSYIKKHPGHIPEELHLFELSDELDLDRMACDYIAGMTDRYAIKVFSDIFIPEVWKD